MKTRVVGDGGRLGKVIVQTLQTRGDNIVSYLSGINYLVFAHRYRGPESFDEELKVNFIDVWKTLQGTIWLEEAAAVIIGSVCSSNPARHESAAYNLSKGALPQIARLSPVRCNVVSPDTMRGSQAKVTEQQVADVVAFLCSTKGSGIRGQEIRVTG